MAMDLAVFAKQLHAHGYIFCDWVNHHWLSNVTCYQSSEQFVLKSDYSLMVVDTDGITEVVSHTTPETLIVVQLTNNNSWYSTACHSRV